jgi:hypothetical protein
MSHESSPVETALVSDSSGMVLFLDFDGVTHPEPCARSDEFCFLPYVEQVVREHPGVDLVISSSWREQYSLEQLQGFFSADIAPRVVGVTPSSKDLMDTWLPGSALRHEREAQCESWMRQNRPWGTPWLAIDDRAHWFRPDCSDLLLTSSAIGFTPAHQATLKDMIRARS